MRIIWFVPPEGNLPLMLPVAFQRDDHKQSVLDQSLSWSSKTCDHLTKARLIELLFQLIGNFAS